MTAGMDDALRSAHLAEMATRCSPVYRVFPALDASALDADARAAVRRALSAIADFSVWQEIHIDQPELDRSLDAVLRGDPLPPAAFAAAWRDALESSLPDRRSGALVLHGFVGWIQASPAFLRPLLTGDLGVLFAHAADLGDDGIRRVLADVGSVGPGLAEAAAAFVKTYAETDAAHFKAVASLAALALTQGRRDAMDRLVAGVTLDQMMESRDACRLLPALAAACTAAEAAAPGSAIHLLEAASRLADGHLSSTYGLVRRMPRILKRLPASVVGAYLAGSARLLEAAGPRLIGYVLDSLPGVFRKNAAEAETVVTDAAALALQGGTTAAEWYLERRTAASRR